VLIPGVETLDALAEQVPDEVRALVEKYWPGGLTIILRARSTLSWDLGETRGTVALRMPAHPIALELLAETGPLAVSSANATGEPAATTAAAAEAMLGDAVAVYLDAGEGGTQSSTIVDATALESPQGKLRIVRSGVIPDADIVRVVGADRCA
jgi:tRNA threonylcarbamoyl adenosine modification protein (Sua5/YciO/YrdC/YwlC family)